MKTIFILTVMLCVSTLSVSQALGEDRPQAGPTLAAAERLAPGPGPAPAPGPAFTAGNQQMFQPVSMDPTRLRQNIQARSEYDDLNRRIMARQSKLYEENMRIKELQTKLRALQMKIDKLLAQDEELIALKKNYEAVAPEFPMGARKGFPTNTTPFSTNR